MTYKFSVWQVYLEDNSLLSTYGTKQFAMSKAARVNESGFGWAYVSELKVYGGNSK